MKLLKKAQVGGLQGFILSIVTVAIVLAIGLIVLSELGTTAKELGTTLVTNESITLSSQVGALSQAGLLVSVSACRNSTDPNNLLTQGGCNVSSLGGVTTSVSNFSDTTAFLDYTHFISSGAFNSTTTIITKLATVPTWIGIIIIVALAFIVLSFFIGRRQ